MGKARDGTSKNVSDSLSNVGSQMHGDEAGLVKVNGKASGRSKIIENFFEQVGGLQIRPANNKSIVGILEDGAGASVVQRMPETILSKG